MVRRPVLMIICGVAAASLFGTAAESFAQAPGGATRSTTTGGGSMGSQFSGGGTGSQSGTGSSPNRTTGTGGSGSLSSSGVTGSSMGPTLNAGDGSLGQRIRNSTGFVGGATSSQSGWIGGNPSTGSTSRMSGMGSNNPFSQFRNMFGGGMNSNWGAMGGANSQAQTQSVTPQLTLGFAPTPPAPMVVENSLRSQIATLPRSMPNTRNISADVDAQGLVTLTGSVTNENDRKVLEHLIRMEPGVRSIENLVIIEPELP